MGVEGGYFECWVLNLVKALWFGVLEIQIVQIRKLLFAIRVLCFGFEFSKFRREDGELSYIF